MQTAWTVANVTRDGAVLALQARDAATVWRRMVGLLNRKSLPAGEGLWLRPCNSIHSIGMRFAFDAVFLDRNFRVVHLIESMAAWRFSRLVWQAASVLELPAQTIRATNTQLGDYLIFTPREGEAAS